MLRNGISRYTKVHTQYKQTIEPIIGGMYCNSQFWIHSRFTVEVHLLQLSYYPIFNEEIITNIIQNKAYVTADALVKNRIIRVYWIMIKRDKIIVLQCKIHAKD